MRFVRYDTEGGPRHGIAEGDRIEEIEGDLFGPWSRTGTVRSIGDVALTAPLEPRTFFAAGQNYIVHATHYPGGKTDTPTVAPTEPAIGYRAVGSLVGDGASIRIPHDASEKIHYEGELVVIIGKSGKHIPRAAVLDHVFGYSIGNDVSERHWQKTDRTPWRAKNADSFNVMGPWIETDFDLAAAETIVRLNGREETRFQTSEMLFGIEDFVSTISEYATLQPGDTIWMGTEGTSPDMKAGDVVEVEITGIGILRNPVTRDASPG
jgi:2-keto-4-pentenoate hydratase/2-oxohepta-3-ene-1,7-dioic acid hydratase in catechol pathway